MAKGALSLKQRRIISKIIIAAQTFQATIVTNEAIFMVVE